MPPSGDDLSGDDHRRQPSRLDELRADLEAFEQAAVEAEFETGRREDTVEEAKRHLLLRALRVTAGSIVLFLGILMLALPGPGLVTVAAGLALLSQDVPFARRLLVRVRQRLPEGEDGNVSPLFIWGSATVAVLAMGTSIWWTFLR
jgi:uncharacterized protein (TIGR02611 family)